MVVYIFDNFADQRRFEDKFVRLRKVFHVGYHRMKRDKFKSFEVLVFVNILGDRKVFEKIADDRIFADMINGVRRFEKIDLVGGKAVLFEIENVAFVRYGRKHAEFVPLCGANYEKIVFFKRIDLVFDSKVRVSVDEEQKLEIVVEMEKEILAARFLVEQMSESHRFFVIYRFYFHMIPRRARCAL